MPKNQLNRSSLYGPEVEGHNLLISRVNIDDEIIYQVGSIEVLANLQLRYGRNNVTASPIQSVPRELLEKLGILRG